jgi:hypothetical protein
MGQTSLHTHIAAPSTIPLKWVCVSQNGPVALANAFVGDFETGDLLQFTTVEAVRVDSIMVQSAIEACTTITNPPLGHFLVM